MSEAVRLADMLELDPALYPEATLYEVLGVLGSGAMGQVLLARDIRLDREVAVKLMNDGGEFDDDARMRFHREARALALLQHPSILRVLSFSGADCPRPFIVTERLHGTTLHNLVIDRVLSETEAVAVGHELCQGLVSAHRAGIIHRDIKPANIVIETGEGRVVLLDFGLAKGIRDDVGGDATFVRSETSIVGTPEFASPEQFNGKQPIAPSSDLFSLASCLYYATTQVLPFRGDSLPKMMRALAHEPHIKLGELIDCSPGFALVIDRMLQKDQKDRFASAEENADAFARLLQGKGPPSIVRRMAEAAPPEREEVTRVHTFEETRTALMAMHEAAEREEKTQISTRVSAPVTRTAVAMPELSPERPLERTKRNRFPGEKSSRLPLAFAVLGVITALALAIVIVGTTPSKLVAPPTQPIDPPALPPALSTASIRIGVKPWGEVWIDGTHRGNAPQLRTVEVSVGQHAVEVRHPTLGIRNQNVTLHNPGEELLVKFDLTTSP